MSNLAKFVKLTELRLAGLDLSTLPDGGVPAFVESAIAKHSTYVPRRVVSTITGDGTDEYELPQPDKDDPLVGYWVDGFSAFDPTRGVRRVTARDYNVAGDYVRAQDFRLERDVNGDPQLRFAWVPSAADDVVLEYTAPHVVTDDASTIETRHEEAIADLAAAMVLDAKVLALADVSVEGQDTDLALGDLSGRGGVFERAAKRYRDLYLVAVGAGPDAAGAAAGGPAAVRIGFPPNTWRWGGRRPY